MTDREKWVSLKESYDERIEVMAKLIKPHSSVLDLGAGLCALKKYLPEGSSYQACDLCVCDENTIVCDFNKNEFPPIKKYDYIFASGLLEYIDDLDYFVHRISEYSNKFIFSYAVDSNMVSMQQRKKNGWVNHFRMDQTKKIFLKNRLVVKKTINWNEQKIFYLEKKKSKTKK